MQRFYGKYKSFCRDHHDPKMRGRIRVEAPYPLGTGPLNWSSWAEPCFQANSFQIPEEGDGVWIEFEAGDPSRPIWSGIWYKGAGSTTEAPFQSTHEAMVDEDGVDVETDRDHTGSGSIDNQEHKEYHDHGSGTFYTPHRFGFRSHSGHVLEFNDHPGKEGGVRLLDRLGRGIEFLSVSYTRLRSLFVSDTSGLWKDLEGANVDGANAIILSDFGNPDDHGTNPALPGYIHQSATAKKPVGVARVYTLLKDMAYSFVRMVSDPGNEHSQWGDFWGQFIRINSVSGSEYMEVHDKAGQTIRLDPVAGVIVTTDKEGNEIRMEAGKITLSAAAGNVILNVPAGSNVHVGGELGEELVTKTHLISTFNVHTHPTATGPSGPPVQQAPVTPGTDITKKAKGE